MNNQPISKVNHDPKGALVVHSIFKTIQGEGPFTGFPAVFVRLEGCNLQCPECDTIYTSTGPKQAEFVQEVLEQVLDMVGNATLVVITGGEPFRQNITPFAKALLAEGLTVQVETNGTLAPPIGLPDGVIIVCSPKTGKINEKTEGRAACLKYVMDSDKVGGDGLPLSALSHPAHPFLARPSTEKVIYLQPMDSKDEEKNAQNVKAVVDSCLKHGYTLQLQVHKYLGVE